VVLNLSKSKIFMTGGHGTLGSEVRKLMPEIVAPTSEECNILSIEHIEEQLDEHTPDIFIHSAAFTDVRAAEDNYIECNDVNVAGTINVIKACSKRGIKLVFISTDYVFDGKTGNYDTDAPINPLSSYAKSKGAAELIVRTYPNHLVIRTSFYGHDFPYDMALVDQWSTKDYIDIVAPKVLEEALSDKSGIVHVGSPRRSTYEIAKTRKPTVKKIKMKDLKFPIPKDISLRI